MKIPSGPLAFLLGTLCTACTASVMAQGNYVTSELTLPEWSDNLQLADMNGDGRKDVIVPRWRQTTGRELLIHLQQSDGRFLSQPDRLVEIKPEIIAVAILDVRAEPGAELLLFSAQNVFSLSSAVPAYSGNLKPLFEWDFIASIPEKRDTFFLTDIASITDNEIELLLPGRDGYGIFRSPRNEDFSRIHQFSTENTSLDPGSMPVGTGRYETSLSINEREGITVNVRARPATAFTDFIVEADNIGRRRDGNQPLLLQTSHWQPAALRAEMNGDDSPDIVYLNIGNDLRPQLNILLQQPDGSYAAQPDWQGPVDASGELRLMDLDGDNRQDLVRFTEEGSDWRVMFYRNQGGSFATDTPDQIMRFSGYDLRLANPDVNGDGKPELSVSYYTIPVVNAIRDTSIVRTQLLFAGSDNSTGQPLYNTRPDFRLEESFSADTVRGLAEPLHLRSDLDADGRNDALAVAADGTLRATAFASDFRLADNAFWQYVPGRSITRFESVMLNDDTVPDLILYHSTSASILVSTP